MSADYQRGYLDGYRDDDRGRIALAESQRLTFAEAMGDTADSQPEADYWVGYYHGVSHQERGYPPSGALSRGDIPGGL